MVEGMENNRYVYAWMRSYGGPENILDLVTFGGLRRMADVVAGFSVESAKNGSWINFAVFRLRFRIPEFEGKAFHGRFGRKFGGARYSVFRQGKKTEFTDMFGNSYPFWNGVGGVRIPEMSDPGFRDRFGLELAVHGVRGE